MFVVISSLVENYPDPRQVDAFVDGEDAMEHAVALCVEQGAPDKPDVIRKEINSDGYYIPTSHAEWSVVLLEVTPTPKKK